MRCTIAPPLDSVFGILLFVNLIQLCAWFSVWMWRSRLVPASVDVNFSSSHVQKNSFSQRWLEYHWLYTFLCQTSLGFLYFHLVFMMWITYWPGHFKHDFFHFWPRVAAIKITCCQQVGATYLIFSLELKLNVQKDHVNKLWPVQLVKTRWITHFHFVSSLWHLKQALEMNYSWLSGQEST